MQEKKVLVAGTFDRFHKGHQFFLKQARSYGTELHVIVACENNVQKIKNKTPQESEYTRFTTIQKYTEVTRAYLGDPKDFLALPRQIQPHVICLGYDQTPPEKLTEAFPHIPIIRIPAFFPDRYKSSLMS